MCIFFFFSSRRRHTRYWRDWSSDVCSSDLDTVMREMETEHLKEAIEGLPERARYVLVRRYGLDDREPATLAELGDELDISRERVRQLQREAERILKGEIGRASCRERV